MPDVTVREWNTTKWISSLILFSNLVNGTEVMDAKQMLVISVMHLENVDRHDIILLLCETVNQKNRLFL